MDLTTASGTVRARRRRYLDSPGVVVRHDEHVAALVAATLAAFTTAHPASAGLRRPPSPAARAEAARLRAATQPGPGEQVVLDFAHYGAAAGDRQRPPSTTPATTNAGGAA